MIVNAFTASVTSVFGQYGTLCGIYHVGRSCVCPATANDLDILFISNDEYPLRYAEQIEYLQDRILAGDPLAGSFRATDDDVKARVDKCAAVLSNNSTTPVIAEYTIGPTRAQHARARERSECRSLFTSVAR